MILFLVIEIPIVYYSFDKLVWLHALHKYLSFLSVIGCGKPMTKRNLERKEFIWFIEVIIGRNHGKNLKQGSNLEAGTWLSRGLGGLLLTSLLLIVFSACFLINPGPPAQGVALPTVGRALPRQSLIKRMLPQTCLQTHVKEAFSQLTPPLFRQL